MSSGDGAWGIPASAAGKWAMAAWAASPGAETPVSSGCGRGQGSDWRVTQNWTGLPRSEESTLWGYESCGSFVLSCLAVRVHVCEWGVYSLRLCVLWEFCSVLFSSACACACVWTWKLQVNVKCHFSTCVLNGLWVAKLIRSVYTEIYLFS